MGGNYSYLKVCLPSGSRTIGFIFEKDGIYKKYCITAGNGSNIGNESEHVNYNFYYNYGKWYYYDGEARLLDEILSNYDPKTKDIVMFWTELKARSNIEEYQSTFNIIKKWVTNVIEYVGKLSPVASLFYFGGKLLGY